MAEDEALYDDIFDVPPEVDLLSSLRDFGYTPETAAADIVDNAIAAGATRIDILAQTADEPYIAFVNNGRGLATAEVVQALRLAAQSPSQERREDDLGRFGLGLKTASLSQCRRLTLISAVDAVIDGLAMDHDAIIEKRRWFVYRPKNLSQLPGFSSLGNQGTAVLWQSLDRIFEGVADQHYSDHLGAVLKSIRDHLALVFHRYLEGERGLPKLAITLNGDAIEPFDPFFRHKSTPRPVEYIGSDVAVAPFTLPHRSRVTPAEYERYGGPEGYLANQGFYVYRNSRLIAKGRWFGLARQQEAHNLSRIRIDIPNTSDEEWKLDVKKASVQPPEKVKSRLKEIIPALGEGSRRTYAARGRRRIELDPSPVWMKMQVSGRTEYRINDGNVLIKRFRERLSSDDQKEFDGLIKWIASSIPLDSLYVDLSNSQAEGSIETLRLSRDELAEKARITIDDFKTQGVSEQHVRALIRVVEPYKAYPELVSAIVDEIWGE